MKGRFTAVVLLLILMSFFTASCSKKDSSTDEKPLIITTTNLIADIVHTIGGDFVTVKSLMGAGIDPHMYKASEGDVIRLAGATAIFHNGLHLEGKLGEVLKRLEGNIRTYEVSRGIPMDELIFHVGQPDPHIWFDPHLWIYAVKTVTDGLVDIDPSNALYYRKNEDALIQQMLEMNDNITKLLNTVPKDKRTLVTSHDAFSYFGRAYGWEVVGIQGINTASETSVHGISTLAKTLADKKVTTIFTETSVSPRSVEALTASVTALGGTLHQGKPLYSDSLGSKGGDAGTYIDMMKVNANSIVSGILNE